MKIQSLSLPCALVIALLSLVAGARGATNFVTVNGFAFQPPVLSVNLGDTVRFTGGDNFHTVTGRGAEPFCGTGFFTACSVTFSNLGSFPYYCIPHQNLNMTGVVHVVAGVTSRLSIVIQGQGTVTPNLDGQDLIVSNSYTVTAQPSAGYTFSGWTGGVTSSMARLTFVMRSNLVLQANFTDGRRPTVAITSPRAGARLTNSAVTVSGTARDNGAFVVEYRLESAGGTNDYQPAGGTTNWTADLGDLRPGAYRIRVRARDADGNLSTETTRGFQVLARLTVTVDDDAEGTVTRGFLGTTYHDMGRRLALLGVPRAGYLFAGWSGDIVSNTNPLAFVVRTNMTLQANFGENPFTPLRGFFTGLFYITSPTNQVRHESSGAFTFLLTDRGRYSGILQVGGKRRPFSGQFGLDGKSTNNVRLPGTDTLSMELMLDLANGSEEVMGRVIDETAGWTATLLGDRTPVHPGTETSPYRGRYTLILEPSAGSQPLTGISYGTVVIGTKGKLVFLGNLADGTVVAQTASVSRDGAWPLYAALYGGRGSLLGWIVVNTNPSPAVSLSGDVSWIKPGLPAARFYRAGFTNTLALEGSLYQSPDAGKVLQIDMGTVRVGGGNLSESHTNRVTLGANNKVTNLTTNQPLVLNLNLPTGLFNGSMTVTDGGARKKLLFKGALLQRQNFGAGFFPGVDQTGAVWFEAVP